MTRGLVWPFLNWFGALVDILLSCEVSRCTLVWPDLETQRLELLSVDNQRNVRSSDNVLILWSVIYAFLGFPESFGLEDGFGVPCAKGTKLS